MDKNEIIKEIYNSASDIEDAAFDMQEDTEGLDIIYEMSRKIMKICIEVYGICKNCNGYGIYNDSYSEWICETCKGKGIVHTEGDDHE